MAINIHTPAVILTTSTSTDNVALPAGTGKYIRIANSSLTIPVYVNAGGSGVTATTENLLLAAGECRSFERDVNNDTHVAALAVSGTPIISLAIVGEPD